MTQQGMRSALMSIVWWFRYGEKGVAGVEGGRERDDACFNLAGASARLQFQLQAPHVSPPKKDQGRGLSRVTINLNFLICAFKPASAHASEMTIAGPRMPCTYHHQLKLPNMCIQATHRHIHAIGANCDRLPIF